MKKYFMKGTQDEVKFGDEIELDFTKVNEETKKMTHHHMEVKFTPEMKKFLIEQEIIEEKDIKEEGILNFKEDTEEKQEYSLEEAVEDIEDIENRLDGIEDILANILTIQENYANSIKKLIATLTNNTDNTSEDE